MKKVALACTGGGVKACVNIGVLRALDDLNIEIDAISGASMGAIIALLYSCNYTPKQIMNIFETDILKFEKFSLLNKIIAFPNLIINGGAVRPKNIESYFEEFLNKNNINIMTDISKTLIILFLSFLLMFFIASSSILTAISYSLSKFSFASFSSSSLYFASNSTSLYSIS